MKLCGIVAEYNPLHNGHIYQMNKAREISGCDVLAAVMSGNFVQRGEAAVTDKWKRAEAAVRNGADIVFELPYIYATQSAAKFAEGGVNILRLAGAEGICFGSECGNLENLQDIASTPVNPDHLHAAMDTGMSYPKAYSLLTSRMMPNDILAVAYLKQIQNTDIKPYLVQRTNDYLSEELQNIASAAAVRKALKEKRDISAATPMADILNTDEAVWMEQYYPYLRTFLLVTPRERLQEFFLFSEGIETLLQEKAAECDDYVSFVRACTSYRYTAGRIRRCCLQALNQVTKEEVRKLPAMDWVRVLAFNETGRAWLKEKRENEVRFVTRFAEVPWPWRSLEYRTTQMYTSVMPEDKRKDLLLKEISHAVYVR